MKKRLSDQQYTRLVAMQDAVREASATAARSGDDKPVVRALAGVLNYALAEEITPDHFEGVSGELLYVLGPVAIARAPIDSFPPESMGYLIKTEAAALRESAA